MRNAFNEELQQLGPDPRVMLLIADTGHYVFRHFAEKFPQQFINIGIAEANLIGVSAGLAQEGNIPFTYSIASFYARCFDQIRVDVCYNKTNVKMVGVGGGLAYGTMGPTHHTIEDIAAFRALPNITILSPCDPEEARRLTSLAAFIDGPVYLRLATAGEPSLSPAFTLNLPIALNRIHRLRFGKHATIVGTGRILRQALLAAEILDKEGIHCEVLNAFMLKPFDVHTLRQSVEKTKIVVTVEEHNILGGLGTIVAESLVGLPIKMIRLGLKDAFCPVYGDADYVFNAVGISSHHIAASVRELLKD